jgi:hypothetical protein
MMSSEEELKGEIARLKQEIERLKHGNKGVGQALKKRSIEAAGERSEVGFFTEEVRSIGMSDGMEKKELKITQYFSPKGRMLVKGKVWRCVQCNTILTEVEKIDSNNNVYCEKCYRQNAHDLDKDDYKLLLCVSNHHTGTSTFLEGLGLIVTLQRLTGITKEMVKKKMCKLKDLEYIFYHGIIFRQIRVSSKGEEALAAYAQVYRDRDLDDVRYRISSARAVT